MISYKRTIQHTSDIDSIPLSGIDAYIYSDNKDALALYCTLSMLISRKKSHYLPPTPLSLNGTVLEVVPIFKYLGVLFSSDLSWTHHIPRYMQQLARKILGLLYRRYYQYSNSRSLLQLYCVFGPTPPGLRSTSMGSSLTARHTLT